MGIGHRTSTSDDAGSSHATLAIPDGWQLVPKEMTSDMWSIGRAIAQCLFQKAHTSGQYELISAYADRMPEQIFCAMLSAAPQPTVSNSTPKTQGRTMSKLDGASIKFIRDLLRENDVPEAAYIDDHVANAIIQRDQERARADTAEAKIANSAPVDLEALLDVGPIMPEVDDSTKFPTAPSLRFVIHGFYRELFGFRDGPQKAEAYIAALSSALKEVK